MSIKEQPYGAPGTPEPAILPRPLHRTHRPGIFSLRPGTRIVVAEDSDTQQTGVLLAEQLRARLGGEFAVGEPASSDAPVIRLTLEESLSGLGPEGYRLQVTPEEVTISASEAAGLFYGTQTLLQLLPDSIPATISCTDIEDRPRFVWRGAMIDVARHFMPLSFLKKFVDVLAFHKLNVLHLHLTDDQGWRLEIKKYPKLTSVGAFRERTLIGRLEYSPTHERFDPDKLRFDPIPHGGFYTQDEMRELVAYAAARHIVVVPEIEMPGHAQAAIAAYPELGCRDERLSVSGTWGVHESIFNPSEATIAFLQDVLEEVMAIFPSPFLHIGGDEAIKTQWKSSPACQARIQALGLPDENALQAWFTGRMSAFIAARERRLLGWDDILEGGLAKNATVMSWRGEKGGVTAAQAGHDVVMAPYQYTYLDFCQSRDESREPLAIEGFLDLETAYHYEPVPAALPSEFAHHILGAQGQLWTEYIPTADHLEYMAFPRLLALAVVTWSPPDKDYGEFLSRLERHLPRFAAMGIRYRPLD